MHFFDEDFYKELDKNYDPIEDDEFSSCEVNLGTNVSSVGDDLELEVNKHNQDVFQDIMSNAAIKQDVYWDSNNPLVKFVMAVLGVIIVVGILYYIVGWISMV